MPEKSPQKILVKEAAETNLKFGYFPENQTLEQKLDAGLIILDKPAGPASHAVARQVKDLFPSTRVEKLGHGGTLDPNATGVLPLTLNRATLVQDVLLKEDKEYIGIMHLHDNVPPESIQGVIKKFQGPIRQNPPSRSAIKRVPRFRTIGSIQVMAINGRDVQFKVACEAGTYIRTLAVDFGKALGCGAHLTALRRTRSGCFAEAQGLVTIQDIEQAIRDWQDRGDPAKLQNLILPPERVFANFSRIIVKDEAVYYLCQGSSVQAKDVAKLDPDIRRGDVVGIFTLKGEIIARGSCFLPSKSIIEAKGGNIAKIGKVYMELNRYPKIS